MRENNTEDVLLFRPFDDFFFNSVVAGSGARELLFFIAKTRGNMVRVRIIIR